MAKTLQFRRGTTASLASETGSLAELFVDTSKTTVVVMDGSTAGGTPLATESNLNTVSSNVNTVSSNVNTVSSDLNTLSSQLWSVSTYVPVVCRRVIYTSGTGSSISPPTGATSMRVTVQGGGGQGGGSPATVGSCGGGGGAGGLCIKWFSILGGTYSYTVGGGGTSSGVNATGQTGGSSTFTYSSITLTASGGVGGTVGGAANVNVFGGTGGTGTNGDVNLTGQPGENSVSTAAAGTCRSGAGAPGYQGSGGGRGQIKTTAGGATGTAAQANSGAGGSGGCAGAATATTAAGGAGGSGIIIVEFFGNKIVA